MHRALSKIEKIDELLTVLWHRNKPDFLHVWFCQARFLKVSISVQAINFRTNTDSKVKFWEET